MENTNNLKKAQEWEQRMIENGHYREHFFKVFADQVNKLIDTPITVLEIGLELGHLAERLI